MRVEGSTRSLVNISWISKGSLEQKPQSEEEEHDVDEDETWSQVPHDTACQHDEGHDDEACCGDEKGPLGAHNAESVEAGCHGTVELQERA